MATIDRNEPTAIADIELFLQTIDFQLSPGLIDFYRETNGANVSGAEVYVILWPLTSLLEFNDAYNVSTYAPEFFIFGSDGGDTAYSIEKATGHIFEMPFIGMSKEEAVFKSSSFSEFIKLLQSQ